MYGWIGRFTDTRYGRHTDGKLLSNAQPPPVDYINHDSNLQESLAEAVTSLFHEFDFGVELDETTVPPTTTATESSSEGGFDISIIIGIIAGVIIAALLIILVIVLVIVFGRRRKEPTHKR